MVYEWLTIASVDRPLFTSLSKIASTSIRLLLFPLWLPWYSYHETTLEISIINKSEKIADIMKSRLLVAPKLLQNFAHKSNTSWWPKHLVDRGLRKSLFVYIYVHICIYIYYLWDLISTGGTLPLLSDKSPLRPGPDRRRHVRGGMSEILKYK